MIRIKTITKKEKIIKSKIIKTKRKNSFSGGEVACAALSP
jgi:hypothetical protein